MRSRHQGAAGARLRCRRLRGADGRADGASARAAQAISLVGGNGGVRSKADGSPVTAADEAAEAVICEGLARLAPAVPIISEEDRPPAPDRSRRPARARAIFWSIRSTARGNSSPAAMNTRSISRWSAAACRSSASSPRRPSGLIWRGIVGRGAERIALAERQIFAAEPHSHAAARRARNRHHGQPLASGGAHPRLCRAVSRRPSSCHAARR